MPDVNRDWPHLSLRVYNVGHGDPLCPDEGMGWYDVLAESWKAGTSSVANRREQLEFLEGVGLCCRPVLNPKATALTHFTTSGGLWQTIYPNTGPRVTHLDQYNTAPSTTEWAATWNYTAPANPSVAFSITIEATNSDWDWTAYPPYVRIELGGIWGVEFAKNGANLVRRFGSNWTAVHGLPSPPRNEDGSAIWVYFRVLRGQIGVSFDFGDSYEWYTPPDANPWQPLVAEARPVLRGRGQATTFGIHQLAHAAGTYDSLPRPTGEARTTPTVAFTGSRFDLNGGSVVLADTGSHLSQLARWRGTLTPAPIARTLWSFYTTPVLYSVAYDLEPVVQNSDQDFTTPWDRDIRTVKVSKPASLSGSSATVTIDLDALTARELDAESYRWRKVELERGWVLSDGAVEIGAVFVGYIESMDLEWTTDFRATLTIKIHNASIRFKRSPWGPFRQHVLSGRTPNEALDFILGRKALGPSYRSWHVAGEVGTITPGLPESPNELTPPNELPWETMVRIAAERGLELGVEDDGTFFTVPLNYVNNTVDRTIHPTSVAAGSLWATGKSAGYHLDFKEQATCALAYGTDETGRFVYQLIADTDAESDTDSPRFTPLGRETRLMELAGTPDAGLATGHCQTLAAECLPSRRDADVVIAVDPSVSRRERWELQGWEGIGITNGTEFRVLTLEENWDAQAPITGLETTAGLWRIEG